MARKLTDSESATVKAARRVALLKQYAAGAKLSADDADLLREFGDLPPVQAKPANIAPNLQALCNAVGTTRDTYNRFRTHVAAPKRLHDGYDVEAWRAFLASQGVVTDERRREAGDVHEIKKEILEEDLIARRDEREARRRLLIPRAEHEDLLVRLGGLTVHGLENLRARLASILGGTAAQAEAEAAVADTLAAIRAELPGLIEPPAPPPPAPAAPAAGPAPVRVEVPTAGKAAAQSFQPLEKPKAKKAKGARR